MKKTILLLAALSLLFSCDNNKPKNNTETPQSFAVETYMVEDSNVLATIGEGEDAYEKRISFECEIDIPVTENQVLLDSICYWIASNFGSIYDGDPRDLKAMVNLYKDYTLDPGLDEDPEGFESSYAIKMLEATDRYVTYRFDTFFEAQSRPRSNFEKTHQTFDRNTGKRFTREMVQADESLEQLVMNELLEQYFSEWSDEDLPEFLYFDPELFEETGFQLPQFNEPWIQDGYLYFGYGTQEIAQYCAGQPQCCLPYSTMKPFLTEEGRAFFE